MGERISDEELRRLLEEATPGPWRLGADLTTINTAYGGDADFVKGGWAKAIAKTTFPKWMPPKQAWPNGQLISLAPALAAEVLQLREENADLKTSVAAFCAPHAVNYAKTFGLPGGHLHPTHYDILERAGARMDSFTRASLSTPSPIVAKEGAMRDLDYKAAFLWAVSGTTGLSAKALVKTAFGLPCEGDYPHDGGDFGRCERAMEMIPGLRDHLPKMVTVNSYWAALVPEWDRIKASKDQSRTIQSIIRPREAADANHVRISDNVSMRFGRPK